MKIKGLAGMTAIMLLALAGCETATPPPTPKVSFVTEKPEIKIPTLTVGMAISSVELPAAIGGSGDLIYDLTPEVPGLTFTATTRVLSGTPTAAEVYNMTYTASDTKEVTASLSFTITVQAAPPPVTTDPAPTSNDVSSGSYLTAVLGGDDNDALTMAGAAALTALLTDDQVAALLATDWWKSPAELAATDPVAYGTLLAALAPMYDMHLEPAMHTVTLRETVRRSPDTWRFIPPIEYTTLVLGAAPVGALVSHAGVPQTESCYLSVDNAQALLGGSGDPAVSQRVASCVTFQDSSLTTMQAVEAARTCAGGGCAGEAGSKVLAAIGATVLSGMIDGLAAQLTDMIIGEWLMGWYIGIWSDDDDGDGLGELNEYAVMHILEDSSGFLLGEEETFDTDLGPWMHRRTSRGGEFVSVDGRLHYRFIPEYLNGLVGGALDHDWWMWRTGQEVVGTWSGMDDDDDTYTLEIDGRGEVVLTVSGAEQRGWLEHDQHLDNDEDDNPAFNDMGFPMINFCGELLMAFPDADQVQLWRYCMNDQKTEMAVQVPPYGGEDWGDWNLILFRQ